MPAYLSENCVEHHFGEGVRTMMLSLIQYVLCDHG